MIKSAGIWRLSVEWYSAQNLLVNPEKLVWLSVCRQRKLKQPIRLNGLEIREEETKIRNAYDNPCQAQP